MGCWRRETGCENFELCGKSLKSHLNVDSDPVPGPAFQESSAMIFANHIIT
jgi:hypothetical protein